jgi:hypothetical protein
VFFSSLPSHQIKITNRLFAGWGSKLFQTDFENSFFRIQLEGFTNVDAVTLSVSKEQFSVTLQTAKLLSVILGLFTLETKGCWTILSTCCTSYLSFL